MGIMGIFLIMGHLGTPKWTFQQKPGRHFRHLQAKASCMSKRRELSKSDQCHLKARTSLPFPIPKPAEVREHVLGEVDAPTGLEVCIDGTEEVLLMLCLCTSRGTPKTSLAS